MYPQTDLIHSIPWRELIILDACRHDYFVQISGLGVLVKRAVSPGSCTREWAPLTWPDKYEDIIYISSIPFIGGVDIDGWSAADHFFEVQSAWKTGWSDEVGTVLPETVMEMARINRKLHPDKRQVLHFGQPHFPYIGKTKMDWEGLMSRSRDLILSGGDGKITYDRHAAIDEVKWRRAYIDNLAFVWSKIQRIITPKTAITADHGELLGGGEGRMHPAASDHPLLRTVPWVFYGNING